MKEISIGYLSRRTGVATSALRYYETLGLITPNRNAGGQRRYPRSDIRRISFIIAAQKFGFTLPRINELLRTLPNGRTPSKADWETIGDLFRDELNAKINEMERLRDMLSGCIGCGCLSLTACALYNPKDPAHRHCPGSRYLMVCRVATFTFCLFYIA